jgi:putative restriction endonuclease
MDRDYEDRVRRAAMSWLDERGRGQVLRFDDLATFRFEGRRIPLMDPQRGIRKPVHMTAALSIRTSFTPPGQVPPYEDAEGPDGLLRYKYRGQDPSHPENVALRTAFEYALPLIWFVAAAPGEYVPVYPIWIVGDEPDTLQFVVAFDVAQRLVPVGSVGDEGQRRYVESLTHLRLHQPIFRVKVLRAYANQCAMCRLRYPSLLEAAHILPDGHPRGMPVVPNGLSLCKMHHAAYDENLLGVRPDLIVEVRSDVRKEVDGPMLVHGLQEMAGVRLLRPRSRAAQPDPERLEVRYEEFLRAV